MNSSSDNLHILPTSSKSNNTPITQTNASVVKSFHNEENLTKFISNSQSSFSSKANPPRSHIQWIQRRPSFKTNSLTDFKLTDNNLQQNMSITDMTTKDFNDEFRNDLDQTLKYTAIAVVTSDDDDDDDMIEQEILSNRKIFVDQECQAALEESKPKKKTKSSQLKILKSSPQRSKQSTTIPQNPPTTDSTPIIKPIVPTSTTKTEEVKSIITVDTSKARSNLEVVRLCLKELGWKECSHNTTLDSDIYWHSSSFHEGNIPFAYNSGRVNKFPGMNDLLRKIHLTRLLNNMRLLFPNEYNFYPKTWFLPEQNQQFKDDVRYIHQLDKKHNYSLTTFIVKPSDGSQGEGIYLLRDPSHIITTNRPHVIQEYIDRPLLINGLKFDLRIYVLILNLHPLEIFLYEEGLVRFATVDYKAPSSENLHQTYMHLTNYSLNKRSIHYKHTIDDKQTDGSKRKLTTVWSQLSQMFGNDKIEHTKNLIVEMINKTIIAILPELRVEYEYELPLDKKQNISCFQIIGFDVILTDKLKPILLEVNANPSLRIDFDKENEIGKIVYQSSLIDEEIKKPLVLETLKLALPKKKLNTIARHAQIQANDEIMAQRVEKVARRRVDERSEKMKSARKTRFDMRLNPFFSRPLESIAKEFVRQQQEQQQFEQKKLRSSSPTHPIIISRTNEVITAYTFNNNLTKPIKNVSKTSKKLRYSTPDDHESGSSPSTIIENLPSAKSKRRFIKSSLTRPTTTTDAAMIRSINTLKLIYPSSNSTKYRHFLIVDKIAQIYIQFVVALGYKSMTGGQFRTFANVCGILNETITAPSIDILYYQMLRKWQQFVLRTTLTGLPFAGFIEAVFLLSQRKFPHAHNLFDSVNHLMNLCDRYLNTVASTSTSSVINQPLLQRTSRNNNNNITSISSLNIRSSVRSSTTTSVHRSLIIPPSAPATKDHHQISKIIIDDRTKHDISRQSTKSVFPLFFDVL